MYLAEFFTIAVYHLIAVASPGPDFAIILRQSTLEDHRIPAWTSLGIALGILVHMTYCILGVGLLLSQSESVFSVVKFIGGIYLIYLGWSSLRAANPAVGADGESSDQRQPSIRSAVLTGFLTNGLNPKATLFFFSLFSVVISTDTPVSIQVLYGLYMSTATFMWFFSLSFFLTRPLVRGFMLRNAVWFQRVMGVALIFLALNLIFF